MIKSRRTSAASKPSAARTATLADRQVAKGKAKRAAAANARRGLATTAQPSAQEIEMEVYRQTRRATSSTKKQQDQQVQKGRKPRSQADIKTKARNEKKAEPRKQMDNAIPPTWIGGTRRPPSKKAVTAAVEAMQKSGFKVPKGMQMVISFAPAPNHDPTLNNDFGNTKANPNNNAKKPNNNNKSFKVNSNSNIKGGGGGRGRGGGGRRN